MQNILIGLIILIIVGLAILYIVKEKKKGTRCIGCSSSGTCPHCNRKKNNIK